MTRQKLDEYRSKKDEIKELKYKLEHLGEGDSGFGYSVINDYRTGYPHPQAVVGVDWGKMDRLNGKYHKRIEVLTAECSEVELWIEEIPDSITRRIFRMYYIDGMSQQQIAQAVHLDRSRISRKIDKFLKNAHKAQNAPL